MTFQQLLTEALSLSLTDRQALRDAIDASLGVRGELSAEWQDELERRLSRLDSGEEETIDAEAAFAAIARRRGAGE